MATTESAQYETDMENKNYDLWLTQHPSEYVRIFADLIRYSGEQLNQTDVQRFVDLGLDLNELHSEYPSDSYKKRAPLHSACEFRLSNLIEPLLKLGAKVNLYDENRLCPLDHLLSGHGALDVENYDHVEQGVKLLEAAKVKKKVKDYIKIDCCEIYRAQSEHLKQFLESCSMRKSGTYAPSGTMFEQYCENYPLCFLDFAFIDRHYHLLTSEFIEFIRAKVGPFRAPTYLEEKETNRVCAGCPECVFGACYNDLTDEEKSYIKQFTDFKSQ